MRLPVLFGLVATASAVVVAPITVAIMAPHPVAIPPAPHTVALDDNPMPDFAATLVFIGASVLLCHYEIIEENYRAYYAIAVVKSMKPGEGIESARKALDATSLLAAKLLPDKYYEDPNKILCPMVLDTFGPSGRLMKNVIRTWSPPTDN